MVFGIESIRSKFTDTKLSLGEGTYIGRNAHIVSLKSIRIGKNVLMGDNVLSLIIFIVLQLIPYKEQGVGFKAEVEIGDGTWIGENVCIISSTISKQCGVGANSLVINDIPDYSMVAKTPARVIKKYNHVTKSWERLKITHENSIKNIKLSCFNAFFSPDSRKHTFIFLESALLCFSFFNIILSKNLYKRNFSF